MYAIRSYYDDSGIKNVGYAFNGVYSVNRHWEAELSFTHIFKRKQLGNNVLDFNAHYVFVRPSDKLSVYGLAGMGFNFLRITDVDKDYYTDTRLGLNVGLGANYKIADKLSLAPLLCYTFSESGYTRLGVSIQYQF